MFHIVHLSDFHFRRETAFPSAEKVVSAFRGLNASSEAVFVVASGDIAFSGKTEQYDIASDFFIRLFSLFDDEFDFPCELISCPGNHDCDIENDYPLRSLAIESVRRDDKSIKSTEIVNTCLRPQKNFFDWADSVDAVPEKGLNSISWSKGCELPSGIRVTFSVLNTSWMSSLDNQGSLFFPLNSVPDASDYDIAISLLHHPLNWFDPDNARVLRGELEKRSSIILTGHEHDCDNYAVTRRTEITTGYVDGGAYGGGENDTSAFNIIEVDTQKTSFRVFVARYDDDRFKVSDYEPPWNPLSSLSVHKDSIGRMTAEWERVLNDPGIQLTHSAKSISIDDIYIPPILRTYENADKGANYSEIPSEKSLEEIFRRRRAYILGDVLSGKTALAKMIYKNSLARGLTPVYINGTDISRYDDSSLANTTSSEAAKQYGDSFLERLWQLSPDERVLVVDDFQNIKFNAKGKLNISAWAKQRFGFVFLIGGDLTQIEDVITSPEEYGVSSGYYRFEIRPFGHLLRGALIDKWVNIGNDNIMEEEAIDHKVRTITSIVNNIIGIKLIPTNPAYILIILQQLEAEKPLDVKNGSYCYLYEIMLTMSLSRASSSGNLEDVDMMYTYFSELAWYIFNSKNGSCEIDEEELLGFTEKHLKDYRINKDVKQLVKEILNTRLVYKYGERYRIGYRYFYYYFVARYIHDNQHSHEVEEIIDKAIKNIHRTDYANILMFAEYLTRDRTIIDRIIGRARSLLAGVEPCDLVKNVEFIGKMQQDIPEFVLRSVDPREERRKELNHRDENEHTEDEYEVDENSEDTEKDISLLLSVNSVIKTMQVLGQILRNSSGSLKRDIKREITDECIAMALRVLNLFCQTFDKHKEYILGQLAEMFGKDMEKEESDEERIIHAKRLIFVMFEALAFSTLRRISDAVGSEILVGTYTDLEEVRSHRAYEFAQLAIRLDHFKSFPHRRVEGLWKKVKDDVFGATLLRWMITDHFYVTYRDYKMRQSVCDMLGIAYPRAQARRAMSREDVKREAIAT